MRDIMKALVVPRPGGPAEMRDVPPPRPDAGSVLVRVHYSGVSVGTEMWTATGRRWPENRQDFLNPGYQAAGEVVEIGDKVEGCNVGDIVTVFCQNSHAECVVARQDLAHKLPDAALCKVAALFVQPSVGANVLNHADVRSSDTVYVVGQGLVGQATAMLARLRGAYVIASDISPERLAISAKHCADWVIDASGGNPSEQINARFKNGVDVVIESTGFQQLLDDAFRCCTHGGRFVFGGWYPDNVSYNFHLPHERQLRAFYPCFIGPPASRHGVLRLMASGKLDVAPLISHLVPGREAASVYNKLFTKERDRFNGIVFQWA